MLRFRGLLTVMCGFRGRLVASGESFISPEVQRQKIEGWAQLHGVEIVRWWEELDQSGSEA